MIIVGIDPDSDRHGVSVYEDGKLIRLLMMRRVDIIDEFRYMDCLFSIEHVSAHNALDNDKSTGNARVDQKIIRSVGKNQQSQIELMRDLDHYSIPYLLNKRSAKWKKGNKEINEFKLVTGWKGRSNPDTRSAAYFGFLALNRSVSRET